MSFRVASRRQELGCDGCTVVDYAGTTARYLTDGVNLYRFVGAMASAMGLMIGLEDCSSLDVLLVPIGELHARRLRAVEPAAR